ncbi:MAG TPA: wax ester/triacylglycerol synthase domain-containing protein [Dermatophilaceae bacterium]|nr:wax ester/triacylglycerol synthase domain-containing protein [Dermatophilaceae bacterium]
MKPMTSTERIFLRLERPGYPIDVVGVYVVAASADEGPLPFEHVRQRLDLRAHTIPLLWRKVASAPLGIGEDRWVQASRLNIDEHLRQVTVPAPGNTRAMLDVILDVTKDPLDRNLPLWQAWYLEGLENGRTAFLLRTHHALVDGMGGMEINDALFDTEPVPVDFRLRHDPVLGEPDEPVLWRALREVPDRMARELVATTRIVQAAARAVGDADLGGRVGGAISAAPKALTQVRRRLPSLPKKLVSPPRVSGSDLPHLPRFVPSVLHHPPRTLLNRHVSDPAKSIAVIDLPFEHVQEIRSGRPGVTINDILLTLVTGALRGYLAGRDDLPDRPLWTTCPVNLRSEDDHDVTDEGNNFTTMWVELPVHLDDPAQRLRAVQSSSAAAKKNLGTAQASWDALANVGDLLLPGVVHAAMVFAGTPVFEYIPPTLNLTVSTMRGPSRDAYFAGRRIENYYGRMIICPPVHLFIHSVTYNGLVEFGVTSVKELVPDPEVIAEGLRTELELQLSLVHAGQ